MNKMIFASVAAALTGFAGSPTNAEAGHRHNDEAIAAVGGFIGGLIVGSAIHHDLDAPRGRVHGGVDVVVSGRSYHRHGHWETVLVKTWVPGHWAYRDRDCNRSRRVWVAGHYVHRRERVWVEHRRGDVHTCH